MRIVHRPGRHESPSGPGRVDRPLVLDIADPSVATGELAAALTGQPTVPAAGLILDGTWFPATSTIAELGVHVGSVLEPALTPPNPPPTPARLLATIGGLRAGGAVGADTAVSVGRSIDCTVRTDDPTVGRRQFTVAGGAVVAGTETTNPTTVDGVEVSRGPLGPDDVVTAGASQFAVRPAADDRPLAVREGLGAAGGLLPFNRPPRPAPAVDEAAVDLPAEPAPPESIEPPSVATLVLPVLAGAVMAVVFSPYMAIFTALGPLLTLGSWWERRRRARRTHRRAVRALDQALAALAESLPDLVSAERSRRRRLVPDLFETVRRASTGSVRLWERRIGDADAHLVGLATTTVPYAPPRVSSEPVASAAEACLADAPPLRDIPLDVTLGPGTVIGIVGPAEARQAVGRSLVVQLATHHGPADLAVTVVAEPDHVAAWDWSLWLPHAVDRASGELPDHVVSMSAPEPLDARLTAGPGHLVIVDGNDGFGGRGSAGRRAVAADHTIVVALVDDTHRLPAGCDHLVTVDELGRLEVVDPRAAVGGRVGLAWGLGVAEATTAARGMARFDDPDLTCAGAGIPGRADLLGLLALAPDADSIRRRWAAAASHAGLAAPIGRDADGPVVLDLVADGPHVLVGGTTGAGKSELLRSLVASLAATADPEHVAFVLVDYKGGAAFDCCADLPHVAGLVTDLDADLVARALRCLDAELHARERQLRSVGAEDLAAYRSATAGRSDLDPLPRLVLVVDEFASLAADLPDFLDALVGIAQRGRSLGVHMVLATQRPGGVVTEDIRANTGCRIALRVAGRSESADIIDAPDAATIPRTRPGRAVARFGPGELVGFQSALVTGRSSTRSAVSVRRLATAVRDEVELGPTDLERLVAAIRAAHGDRPRPKAPWPAPLPLAAKATEAGWWLVDRPDEQRQSVEGWRPADGHLVVLGGPGSGTSTSLVAAACVAIDEGAHVHGVDLDAGLLASLRTLPAVGTIADPVDAERRRRVLRWLADEVERRRGAPDEAHQRVVFVVDDLGGLARAHDPVRQPEPHDQLAAIWADGPAVGVSVVVGLRRAADLPPALAAGAGTILVHDVLDPGDAQRFGIRTLPDAMPPGRAVRAADGLALQVLVPAGDVAGAIEQRSMIELAETPHRIGTLAAQIALADVVAATAPRRDGSGEVVLPLGVRDDDLAPASITLHPGDHALVTGPARSGRTTTLATIGGVARRLELAVVVVADRPSPLAEQLGLVAVAPERLVVDALDPATVVLVDDALDIGDPGGALAALAGSSAVFVVAAVRPDRLRAAFGHWVTELRASRTGVLLQPDPLDGDLLGAPLPARLGLANLPGRGVVVDAGVIGVAQIAHPGDGAAGGAETAPRLRTR